MLGTFLGGPFGGHLFGDFIFEGVPFAEQAGQLAKVPFWQRFRCRRMCSIFPLPDLKGAQQMVAVSLKLHEIWRGLT